MQNLIGQSIGRYHIIEQLGEGGMATVYKAFDTQLERDVAIKVIRADAFPPAALERMHKRFEREAKSMAKMSHSNIVNVHDYGEFESMPFLVMEYFPGGTMKSLMGRPMSSASAVALLIPIARALGYAHNRGLLHRDVKPANILITEEGQPVLTDFGIAKVLDDDSGHTLTGTGVGIGTPEYMAPEQGLGKEVDGRADEYALGIILYELVTGRKPFQADTPLAVLMKQVNDPLPRPGEIISDLPEATEKVIYKALAKNPDDRYLNMSLFASALESLKGFDIEVKASEIKTKMSQKDFVKGQDETIEYSNFSRQDISKTKKNIEKGVSYPWIIAIVVLVGLVSILFLTIFGKNKLNTQNPPAIAGNSDSTLISEKTNQIKLTAQSDSSVKTSITETETSNKIADQDEIGKSNINNYGLVATQGDWTYFSNPKDGLNIYKINQDRTIRKIISFEPASYINIVDNWIYFRSGGDGSISRMNLAGFEQKRLTDDSSSLVTVYHDWIYYRNDSDGKRIYRVHLDGSERKCINNEESYEIIVAGEWIYFINGGDGYTLYKMHLDGTGVEKLTDDSSSSMVLLDDKIYYRNENEGGNIYFINQDGSSRKRLNNSNSYNLNSSSGWIFYINGKRGNIERIQPDGNGQEKLNSDESENINIVKDWIYYTDPEGRNMYRMHLDGSEREEIN